METVEAVEAPITAVENLSQSHKEADTSSSDSEECQIPSPDFESHEPLNMTVPSEKADGSEKTFESAKESQATKEADDDYSSTSYTPSDCNSGQSESEDVDDSEKVEEAE